MPVGYSAPSIAGTPNVSPDADPDHWLAEGGSSGGGGGSFATLSDVDFDSNVADGDIVVFRDDSNGGHWRAEVPPASSFSPGGDWNQTSGYSAGTWVLYELGSVLSAALCHTSIDPPALIMPDIDGSASNAAPSVSNLTTNLTTDGSANLICCAISCNNSNTVVTSSHLTWTKRVSVAASGFVLELWTAPASGALTAEAILSTPSGASYIDMVCWGIKDVANNVSPFDSNGGLPFSGNGTTLSLSTDEAADFLIYLGANTLSGGEGVPSGFTQIETTQAANGLRLLVAYQRVSASQSGVSFTIGSGHSGIVDAVVGFPGDANPTPDADPHHWIT
jgi:hypothetical protein